MSIADQICQLEADGKLTRYVPPQTRVLPKRRLFLSAAAVQDRTDRQKSAVLLLVGRARIDSALTRWVSGERIYGDAKGKHCFLKRLEGPPSDIWEVRVVECDVQARLFGRFAEQDTLILTKFHTRRYLGKRGSTEWRLAMTDCERAWNALFGITPPHPGTTIHHFVSANCDDYPID
ncbi:MAG TPA: hypothetical protein VFW28_01275 [Micropepsaceae bacterium]|nr:hypothetical protein [Micropepsaceae bacterium]